MLGFRLFSALLKRHSGQPAHRLDRRHLQAEGGGIAHHSRYSTQPIPGCRPLMESNFTSPKAKLHKARTPCSSGQAPPHCNAAVNASSA